MIGREQKSLRWLTYLTVAAAAVFIIRLFSLQVLDHGYYSALASDAHEIYKQLFPKRGSIYIQDSRNGLQYPAAINRNYYLIYAVPRDIKKGDISSTTRFLSQALNYSPEEEEILSQKLSKTDDPYEPIAKKIPEEIAEKIKEAGLKGINFATQEYRYYPEKNLASHVLGFTGFKENGETVGRYGIEGFWDEELAGQSGFLAGERGAFGGLIPLAGRTLQNARDGADLFLTIDRNLEDNACGKLAAGFKKYEARSAALVMMDPTTGAILAMCGVPDFDPNKYSEVKDAGYFNNSAIFQPYEQGSVFKAITMAIALDAGAVKSFTTYKDSGEVIINGHKLHNALNKIYGAVNMTGVLENSINTAMTWVAGKIGRETFKKYVEKFGFGKKTGIELETEAAGNVDSFDKPAEIYNANASFGQGFTATPLQLVAAYAALANGGRLPEPYIVDEIRYPSGQTTKTEPKFTETVVSPETSKIITAMLVSVVENGHAKKTRMDDYLIAAKTGTAQIAKDGKYTEETDHTFLGFFPASKPKFVLLVKYEAPNLPWAESTALPVFRDVAKFTLDYYGVPGDR